ncbi:MAG TPA: Ig domain-containing protein, partial [Candidatus Acidoferrales bacterium]
PGGNLGSPYTATVTAKGGSAPFMWSIESGSLTAGLSLGSSTTGSVTIAGTPTAQVDSNFTIMVTDSKGSFSRQPLTIAIGAPLPLAVATTTLPGGVPNQVYVGATLRASGGVPPFTWTIIAGNLPAGLFLASTGVISGTPTAAGTANFTVQVTDSEASPMTATANLSITVGNLAVLSGDYAFEFSGFNSGGQVVIAGSFTADGAGTITNGVEDINTMAGPPKNQTFTGTYTLGSDNRGQLVFSSLTGSPTFAFAIDPAGAHGRLIEFDSSGIRGSGQLEQRTVSTCAFNTLTGNYAFGVTGEETAVGGFTAGPSVVVGSFLATPPASQAGQGAISAGEADSSAPNGVTGGTGIGGLSGSFKAFASTPQNTRCTMTLSPVNINVSSMTFSVYPVSSTEAFLAETDTVGSTTPFLTAGKMLAQTGSPFSGVAGSTFTATSVAGMVGQFPSGSGAYEPDLALVSLTGSSSNSYNISILENRAGTVMPPFNPGSLAFVSSDQFGRVDSGLSAPISLVFYIINQNEAFAIGESLSSSTPVPFFGILEPQSPSPLNLNASDLNSTFVLGTSAPATSPVTDISGSVALANTSSTAGTIAGTQDQGASGGNSSAQTITGTYAGLSSTAGSGTLALTAPAVITGDFLVVSPTKILVLSTTASDANPILLFLGNCETTCGED